MSDIPVLILPEPADGKFPTPIDMVDTYARIVGVEAQVVYYGLCYLKSAKKELTVAAVSTQLGLSRTATKKAIAVLKAHNIVDMPDGKEIVLRPVEQWTE